jgi:hypothetical protein
MNANKIALMVAACGVAAGMASAQSAPVFLVSGSGATLLETLWRAPAATNDYIDADGNGQGGVFGTFPPQQLALTSTTAGSYFGFTYRFTGSGNGIREFDIYGELFDVCPDGSEPAGVDFANIGLCMPAANPAVIQGNSAFSDDGAIYNRDDINTGGVLNFPPAVAAHRGGTPFVTDMTTYAGVALNPGTSGFNIDFSSSDVPLSWFAIQNGTSTPLAAPGGPGYGANPRVAQNTDGTDAAQSNLLRPLSRLNTDGSNPALQVFETPILIAPVSAPVNYGVGLSEINMSDLRHGFATGRRVNGENLNFHTRDSGSGTRNAFSNGIALDPSWCVGENIGVRNGDNILGPNFKPSNKSGSGNMDTTVINSRLGIGHTGAERGVNRGWLTSGAMDVLGIVSDVKGGTVAARPTQANVIDGGPDGYNIVGPAGVSHIGDPRNAPAAQGGWGWGPGETPVNNPFAGNPVPPNPGLSAFVNNITRSVSAFVAVPGGLDTEFTPGEFLADNFFLIAAPDNVPANPDPDGVQPIAIVGNDVQNLAVRNFLLNDAGAALNNAAYAAFNTSGNGRVPERETGTVYSDGVANGNSYINQGGATVTYGQPLDARNRIAFDFNGDGVRSAADAEGMMRAWDERFGSGTAWSAPAGTGAIAGAPGSDAVIEILGDGQGDGNFDEADVRYWADGLVLDGVSGNLDRMAGFMAVDDAWDTITSGDNNFFNTTFGGTLTTSYESGDSVADIAGGANPAAGWAPIGSDGVIDLADVDYLVQNFGDFTDIEDASGQDGSLVDLSADMNGDLVVDAADATKVIVDILETEIGDLDLDGDKDADDRAIIVANQGTGTLYSQGDVNFDGVVDAADLTAFDGQCNPADLAAPFGELTFGDISAFLAAFSAMDPAADLAAPFGEFTFGDISAFLAAFSAGCP